jgi:hypothetical protein
MDVRTTQVHGGTFCDLGPHAGQYRVDLRVVIYLGQQEFSEQYTGPNSIEVSLRSLEEATDLNMQDTQEYIERLNRRHDE